ncbi:hypothetical protein M5K25_020405 [Dendrobium thyrsiflorum]|uniref:Uncharacterized protein n=1 Tax=Dendrobium thyrsiflorum TaxID=117978 RepID=A0ABD0U9U0_DENTH
MRFASLFDGVSRAFRDRTAFFKLVVIMAGARSFLVLSRFLDVTCSLSRNFSQPHCSSEEGLLLSKASCLLSSDSSRSSLLSSPFGSHHYCLKLSGSAVPGWLFAVQRFKLGLLPSEPSKKPPMAARACEEIIDITNGVCRQTTVSFLGLFMNLVKRIYEYLPPQYNTSATCRLDTALTSLLAI